jgi:hypothetical protein
MGYIFPPSIAINKLSGLKPRNIFFFSSPGDQKFAIKAGSYSL